MFILANEKALKIGASKVYIEDLKEEFVTDLIFPAIRANVVYEGRYLMGTSLARPLIAKKQIEIAKKENAEFLAKFKECSDMIEYATKNSINRKVFMKHLQEQFCTLHIVILKDLLWTER